jgi:hypothetical protein
MDNNILRSALRTRYKYDVTSEDGSQSLVIKSQNSLETYQTFLNSSNVAIRINGHVAILQEVFLKGPRGSYFRFTPESFANDLRIFKIYVNDNKTSQLGLIGGSGTSEFWDDLKNSPDLDDYKFEFKFSTQASEREIEKFIDDFDDDLMDEYDESMGEGMQIDQGYKDIRENENKIIRKRRNLDNYLIGKNLSAKKTKVVEWRANQKNQN